MRVESLEELQEAFRTWRRRKRKGTERVPDELIERARLVAAVVGPSRVASRVGLSRSRLGLDLPPAHLKTALPIPGFTRVELAAPIRPTQPLVEVETVAGMKLRFFVVTPETIGLLTTLCGVGGGT